MRSPLSFFFFRSSQVPERLQIYDGGVRGQELQSIWQRGEREARDGWLPDVVHEGESSLDSCTRTKQQKEVQKRVLRVKGRRRLELTVTHACPGRHRGRRTAADERAAGRSTGGRCLRRPQSPDSDSSGGGGGKGTATGQNTQSD